MYKFWIYFVLLTPLAGMILVEMGTYCWQCGQVGHPNGASVAYAIYALLVWGIATALMRKDVRLFKTKVAFQSQLPGFTSLATVVLILNGLFFLFVAIPGRGLQVLSGHIGKGEFRTELGLLGALVFWVTKYFAPALLAYLVCVYKQENRARWQGALLVVNLLVVSLLGLSWGFKAGALRILVPAMLILYWKISFRQLVAFALVTALVLTGTFLLFDQAFYQYGGLKPILLFLGLRLTVLQGDVAWYVWDLYQRGDQLPSYWPTLLPVIGDQPFSLIFGVTRDNFKEWARYHWEFMLTHLVGYPLDLIGQGHNVTAPPFTEGVIAFGSPGYLLFAVVAGLLVAANYHIIRSALLANRFRIAAIASTYFGYVLLAWLNGGGVGQLVHIQVVLGIFMVHVLMRICEMLARGFNSVLVVTAAEART